MEIKDIKTLIDALDQSSVAKLEFVQGDNIITLEKEVSQPVYQMMQPAQPVPQAPVLPQSTPEIVTEAPSETVEEKEGTIKVKAPLVGVFYAASSPEAQPFVTVGQQVKEGETVCILEAMKVLNEIKAPTSGTVTAIYGKNGDVVEFDQVLLEIGEAHV